MVAGLTATNFSCKEVSSVSRQCRITVGSRTGIIALSRFEHTRSETSHRIVSASRTSAPYRARGRRSWGSAAGFKSKRMACFRW